MSGEARGVQSVEVGAALLEVMARSDGPMMLRDIASAADIAAAQAHAYLVSFRKIGLVEQDPGSGYYRLGEFALTLALAKLRRFDPIGVASRHAAALSEESGLTVAITVWSAYGPMVVRVHEGVGQVHMNTRPGTIYSMTGTATGRLFAHYLPRELVATTIRRQRADAERGTVVGGAPDLKSVRSELEFIAGHGYSPIDSAPIPGISALAVPVFEIGGQLSLTLTLIGSVGVIAIEPGSAQVARLLQVATSISAQLGHVTTNGATQENTSNLVPDEEADGLT